MDNNDTSSNQAIEEANRQYRLERARLPFVEKLRILIKIQKRHAIIAKFKGKTYRVWDVEI